MKKGLTQIELSKMLGASYSQVNMQIKKHRILPEKYQKQFCAILGITIEELNKAMKEEK